MQHFWALTPVMLTLFIAFQTRQMLLAFISGIFSAALIVKNFDIPEAAFFSITRLLEKAELKNLLDANAFWRSEKLFIFIFLICIGSIIELIRTSGASQAYATFIKKHLICLELHGFAAHN